MEIDNGNCKEASSWLSVFLNKKNRSADVVPIDDLVPLNPIFLQDFQSRFSKADNLYFEQDSEEIILPTENDIPAGKNESQNIVDNNGTILKMFNLPYNITEKEIIKIASSYGIEFSNVSIDICKKTDKPSGAATATLPEHYDIKESIAKLQSTDFKGRQIRIETFQAYKSKKNFSNDRYYVDFNKIDCKCNNCGEVGHKAADCTNPPQFVPCHLCAGNDHEPGDCPNIICFNCGDFGHHSRQCRNARTGRTILCTLCGSSTHERRFCPQLSMSMSTGSATMAHNESYSKMSRFENAQSICMSCGKLGHNLCQTVGSNSPSTDSPINCPNCGNQDHHVDFMYLTANSSTGNHKKRTKKEPKDPLDPRVSHPEFCTAPRMEAYLKFPQISQSVEMNNGHIKEYYKIIADSTNTAYDMRFYLFPMLLENNNSHANNHYNSSSNNNRGEKNYSKQMNLQHEVVVEDYIPLDSTYDNNSNLNKRKRVVTTDSSSSSNVRYNNESLAEQYNRRTVSYTTGSSNGNNAGSSGGNYWYNERESREMNERNSSATASSSASRYHRSDGSSQPAASRMAQQQQQKQQVSRQEDPYDHPSYPYQYEQQSIAHRGVCRQQQQHLHSHSHSSHSKPLPPPPPPPPPRLAVPVTHSYSHSTSGYNRHTGDSRPPPPPPPISPIPPPPPPPYNSNKKRNNEKFRR